MPAPKKTPSHFSITQAGLISAFTFLVGQVVAFVPQFGTDKQNLISAGSAIIAAVFMTANSVHKLADSNVSAKDVRTGAIDAAKSEISKVDLNALVNEAVNSKDLAGLAKDEVRSVLSSLFVQPQPVAAPAVAPPVAPPAA